MAAPPAHAAAPVPVTRIAGANRFGTAAALAAQKFPAGASTAIVATGFNFPDALAGNYLAGLDKAPILLVNVDNVPSETSSALQSLHVKNVIILGQTNAVSTNTENQLKAAGYTTSRIGGATRLETMQMIDEAPNATTIGMLNGKKTALLARADNFPDALGGGPVAYGKNFPVILTATDALSPQAQDVIAKDGIQQVIILGGNLAVSAAAEQQTNAAGAATLFRANGVDRSDTSRLLAEFELANLGFSNASYAIASGDQGFTGADALTSGAFNGDPRPELITNSVNDPGTLVQYGAAHNGTATQAFAIGGPIPLPDSTVHKVTDAPSAQAATYTFTAGNTPANAANGTSRTFTVSNLAAGTYNVQLFNCANVTPNGDGSFSFAGTNPGAANNQAVNGGTGGNTITNINGTPNTGPNNQAAVTPQSGAITFTVTNPNVAPNTNAAPTCVVPVVFSNADGNQVLELGTNNQPTEGYGVGGNTTFGPPAAAAGAFNVTVSSVDKVGHTFVGCNGGQGIAPCATYSYGPSDAYTIVFPGGTPANSNFAEFNTHVTPADTVNGTVGTTGSNNTFNLNDSNPTPPQNVTAASGPGGANPASTPQSTVIVRFTDSAASTTTSYNVYRALATDNGTGVSPRFTCPPSFPNSTPPTATPQTNPYALVGSVSDTDPAAASAAAYSFSDASLTAGNYCYAVTSVDASGGDPAVKDQGIPAFAQNAATPGAATPVKVNTTPTGAVAGAPLINDVRAQTNGTATFFQSGDVIQFTLNEPVTIDPMQGTTLNNSAWSFTLQDSQTGTFGPATTTITCGGNASCIFEPAGVFNGTTVMANQVIRATLNSSPTVAGGNTGNINYPANITSVGTQVIDQDENLPINLAGSPDKDVEQSTLTPAPGQEAPGLIGANGNATTGVVTATYQVPVICTGNTPGQFTYRNVPATALLCNGTTNIRLTFPAGTLVAGVNTNPVVYNQAANAADRIYRQSAPTVAATSPDQTLVNPVVANSTAPTITSLNPNSGNPGQSVQINGTNFTNGATANFCGTAVATTFTSANQVTAIAPTKAPGTACGVTVTTPSGTSNAATFNYNAAPPTPATITGATASPGSGQIFVNFSQPVTCQQLNPATAAAFNFTNQDPAAGPGTTGAPVNISQGPGANQCTLNYGGTFTTNTFGPLSYNQPGAAGNRITNANGDVASTVTNVADTTSPVFTAVAATGGSTTITLTYNEAVLCSTVTDNNDYTVTYNGVARTINSVACTGTSNATVTLTMANAAVTGQNITVTMVAPGGVTDPAGNAQPTNDTVSNIAA